MLLYRCWKGEKYTNLMFFSNKANLKYIADLL